MDHPTPSLHLASWAWMQCDQPGTCFPCLLATPSLPWGHHEGTVSLGNYKPKMNSSSLKLLSPENFITATEKETKAPPGSATLCDQKPLVWKGPARLDLE